MPKRSDNMNLYNKDIMMKNIILSISIFLIIISIIFFLINYTDILTDNSTPFTYETIDIKKMSTANVSIKKTSNNRIFKATVSALKPESKLTEVMLEKKLTLIQKKMILHQQKEHRGVYQPNKDILPNIPTIIILH